MGRLKKAFKKSLALVAAVVFSVVAFCFPAAAATTVWPVQNVDFGGASLEAQVSSGTIPSKVIEPTMLRFYPGSFTTVGFVGTKNSFFRMRSGYRYRIKFRAVLAVSSFSKICVVLGVPGVKLENLQPENINYSFTFSSDKLTAYFDYVTGIRQSDINISDIAMIFQMSEAVSPFNFWVKDFTVEEIDPNQEIVDGIGDRVDKNTDKITGNTDPEVGGAGDKADELNGQIGDYNQKEDEVIDLLNTSTDEAFLKYNPFKQLNFVALAVAFSGFTSTFNAIVAALGVHFSTLIAFSICAGFFALIVGVVIRPGNRPPPKN